VLPRKRVLFVDDEPRFLEGLKRMLRGQENAWEVGYATSADEALEMASQAPHDLLVVDVAMPRKDGFELLAELRNSEKTKDVPVVFLTGSSDHAMKRRALDLGAADLLSKPVGREDLIARVRSVLRLKAHQDRLKAQNQTLAVMVTERTLELEESRREIIWRLAKAGEYRDDQTGNHIARVGCYCRVLAEALGMDRAFTESLFLTSPLHDIGKIGIPDEILLKPGSLTPEEREVMERHCAIGSDILVDPPKGMLTFLRWHDAGDDGIRRVREDPLLKMASAIAMTHHERWNGRGYPLALKGEEIPLESRIVGLSDVYDALRSARPYKQAYSEERAVDILRDENGQHFDPAVYAAFQKAKRDIRAIRAQFLDGAEGVGAAA
jgi:putative two-component system response regulator